MQFIQELQIQVHQWGRETFGDRTVYAPLKKMAMEEVPELLVKYAENGHIDPGEIADVFILALDICAMEGIDAGAAIRDKMVINRDRDWIIDKDGVGNHVRTDSD